MIHKGRMLPIFALLALSPSVSHAELRSTMVMETSTSGRLVRLNIGGREGLALGQPVLFSASSKKIAAGRVIRVENTSAVVAVLEKYGDESPRPEADYELLYGEPFPEAANLPDYVADREEEKDNPNNERFWTQNNEETSPELDDDNYTPEVAIRPKFPEGRTYNTHNITVGLNIFRNHDLATDANPSASNDQTTYSGYSLRYAYTFRSHYWLKTQTPALLSAEFGVGTYTFSHTFPTSMAPMIYDPATQTFSAGSSTSEIRVVPIQVELRYLVEVSKLFRLYPYLGYQYNIVSAGSGSMNGTEPLAGGRILGGAGAVLVMSDTIDARIEGGTDGVLAGAVVKF